MNGSEINDLRKALATRQTELALLLRKRDGIAIEPTPDALDQVHLAMQRELVSRNLERESKLLRDVNEALGRIAEGTYGTCLRCEEEIAPKRLSALPWTALCIGCQEQADRDSGSGFARPLQMRPPMAPSLTPAQRFVPYGRQSHAGSSPASQTVRQCA
jgi:DnaK suppressor protein